MENKKSFFIAVVLIVGALYFASIINPQPTGQFYIYNPNVNIQPKEDTNGLNIAGTMIAVKKIGTIIKIDLRNTGGGYISLYAEESVIKKEVLNKLNTLPAGTLIRLTYLEKKKKLKAHFQMVERVEGASPPYEGLFIHI